MPGNAVTGRFLRAPLASQIPCLRTGPCRGYVHYGIFFRMPPSVKSSSEPRPTRKGKVRKEFWLDPKTLHRAQVILGTATERETVEVALDMIAFRRELLEGTRMLSGLKIDPVR